LVRGLTTKYEIFTDCNHVGGLLHTAQFFDQYRIYQPDDAFVKELLRLLQVVLRIDLTDSVIAINQSDSTDG
jgi:hypothetical protein